MARGRGWSSPLPAALTGVVGGGWRLLARHGVTYDEGEA